VAESQLTFAGLLVLENRLKPETLPALAMLRKANIRVVMATGTGFGCFTVLYNLQVVVCRSSMSFTAVRPEQ